MSGFTADYSSSTASTPQRPQRPQKRLNLHDQSPELASTTPLAPPPSQLFGSSQTGGGVQKLRYSNNRSSLEYGRPKNQFHLTNDTPGRARSRMFQLSTNTVRTEEGERADEYPEDEDMQEDDWEEESERQYTTHSTQTNTINKQYLPSLSTTSLMKFSINSSRQPSNKPKNVKPTRTSQASQLPSRGKPELVPSMTRDICRRTEPAALRNDTDDVIVVTEDIMRQLEEETEKVGDNDALQALVHECVQEVDGQWRSMAQSQSRRSDAFGTGKTPFQQAQYLSSLLLRLYHSSAEAPEPPAQILLHWLDQNHLTYDTAYQQVARSQPNCTSHELFWDTVESLTARGKLIEVMHLLAEADFNYARIDTGTAVTEANYTGTQLQAIQSAVLRARQTLNICPAVQEQDWNVDNGDWDFYRKEVELALDDLTELAETHGDDEEQTSNRLPSMVKFGLSTRKSRGLPFEVYQHIKTIYAVLLGSTSEIVSLSQDWVEASMLLTVWWNGIPQTSVAQWSFDVSKANQSTNAEGLTASVHLNRLKDSFLSVTDPDNPDSFQLNVMSSSEIGLAAIFQGEISSFLAILQTMSLCLASTVAEIGAWAGWYTPALSAPGFDQDDLIVLTYGTSKTDIKKDEIMERYAQALFKTEHLRTSNGVTVEGWELAFSVISRLDEEQLTQSTISEFIASLQITDKHRAGKLVALCEELGLKEESQKVSESFGDHLINSTSEYGTALLCYARSHSEHKIRQLIDLLNSYCLVQSKAYPPNGDLDKALERLVSNPREALSSIAEVDPDAVDSLQFYLVGYACIRKFYNLRDEKTASTKATRQASLRTPYSSKAAAQALIAAVNSAADSIYGGLYDPERRTAIQIDCLLTLLGEATAFLNGGDGSGQFTSDQMYALLAAAEDLETVNDRVYAATEECLQASLHNYRGSLPPSPHAMLKKSMSSGTNSNFSFSMMGSEMLTRSEESLGGNSTGGAVVIGKVDKEIDDVQRGWDWRARFKDQGATGADVTRYLRRAIARELSIVTLEDSVAT